MKPLLILFLALAVSLGTTDVASAKPAKSKYGMFGTIKGKPFRAGNNGLNSDPCVNGIYKPTDQILTLLALECKGKKLRRHPKKNYKSVGLGCARFDPATPTVPPYDLVCSAAVYQEWKTNRFGGPVGAGLTWSSHFIVEPGSLYPDSTVKVHVQSFDGSVIRAKIVGSFQDPTAPATGAADISGELSLEIPIKVQ